MEDLTGNQLGPYRVIAPLGEGGMAAVYQAYQPGMDRTVALKILPRHFAEDPNFVARFTREARLIANLEHQNILPVYDFGESGGYTYLVMRFVDSGTLADLLSRQHLTPPQIRHVITQVGSAVDYAHARGVLHRDLKPSNVLIDASGNCLLSDFGLAKMAEGSIQLTQTGGILGTPAYMSPEQAMGNTVDARTDIYALGVMLYEMAARRLPFHAETPVALIMKHIHAPLPPPRSYNPNLSEGLERVILKSLAKDPADRFETAGEFVRALSGAIQPEGDSTLSIPARPAPIPRAPATPLAPLAKPIKPIEPGKSRQEAEELEKTGMQFRLYRRAGSKHGLGTALLWFGGFFFALYTAGLGAFALGLTAPSSGQVFPVSVFAAMDVAFGALTYAGFLLRRQGARLREELEARVETEGNLYSCSCGEPMKTYSTIHYLLCCLPPWGLIALFFKLKKCTRCGKPYPGRLLATR